MGNRQSPMKAKEIAARKREFKKYIKREWPEPKPKEREFRMTDSERYRLEKNKRARMLAAGMHVALAMREGLVPLSMR